MKKLLLALIVLGLIVLGAWKLGWVGVTNEPQKTTVTIDKQKVNEDLSKASAEIKDGAQVVKEKVMEAGAAVKNATEKTVETVKEAVSKKKEDPKPAEAPK